MTAKKKSVGVKIKSKLKNIRQKKLAVALVENRGASVSKTMREVGYSDAYSKNPQQLTETDNWKELMEEFLPDSLLAEKHQALLNKMDKGTDQPETQAVSKGLDLAYKVKGKMAPEKHLHRVEAVEVVKYVPIKEKEQDKITS